MQHILEKLTEMRAAARAGGGERRIAAQHRKGKLSARERLEILLDEAPSRSGTCSSSTAAATSA